LNQLIPYFIEEKYLAGEQCGTFEAYTMFIDLTDFTPLTERMAGRGKEGAEQLSVILNGIFSPLVNLVYARGGFIPYFAGDAFTAIFPKGENNSSPLHFIHTAYLMRDLVRGLPLVEGNRVGARFGISTGMVDWGIVGARMKSFFFRGAGIQSCIEAQARAYEQEIVLSLELWEQAATSLEASPIEDGKFFRFSQFAAVPVLDSPFAFAKQATESVVRQFVPQPIWESYLSGEFRHVVSVFLSFEGADCYDDIQLFATTVLEGFESFAGYFKEIDFGDKGGVIVGFFGAPLVFEDNEERSLEFVEAIRHDLRELRHQIPALKFRFGLTSGTAFTGIVGGKERSQYAVVGNRVNHAARLMTKAAWGEVLLDENMQRTRNFSFTYKGDFAYKGFPHPLPTYSLFGKKEESAQVFFKGTMAGREKELEDLQVFAKPFLEKNTPTLGFIFGEAGVGKSRFTYEFRKKLLQSDDFKWISLRADLILRKPFQPFLHYLRKYFRQQKDSSPNENQAVFEQRLDHLVRQIELKRVLDSESTIRELLRLKPILAALVDLPSENSIWELLDARGRYENTLSAIFAVLAAEALLHPVVLEIEDAHGLDDNSRELLLYTLRRMGHMPIFMLLVARYQDDGSKPALLDTKLLGDIRYTEIHLKTLTTAEIRQISEQWVGGRISDELLEQLVRITMGNPFYLEQILEYFVENELLIIETGQWHIRDNEVKVSNSLQSILMSRIDRLSGVVKETVKTAAVIGREFEVPVLSEVMFQNEVFKKSKKGAGDFVREQVRTAEQVHIWHAINELKYIFQHALLRDALYEMQLGSRLRRLHRLIAEAIEKLAEGQLQNHFLELAYHYRHSDAPAKSVVYLKKAASLARENFQNQKALELYDQLLEFFVDKTGQAERIKILLKKGSVLELVGRWDDCENSLLEALALSEHVGDVVLRGRIKNELGRIRMLRGDYAQATALLEEALVDFETEDDQPGVSKTLGNLGNLFFRQGFYEKSRTHLLTSIEKSRSIDFPSEPQIVATLGLSYMNQGMYADGIRGIQTELDKSRRRNDKRALSILLTNLGIIFFEKGDLEEALACYEEGLHISEELGDKQLISIAIGSIGSIYQEKGDYALAMEHFQKDLLLGRELGDKQGIAIANGLIGELLALRGKFDNARNYLHESLKLSSELHYQKGIGKAANNLGDTYYLCRDFEKALEYYAQAVDVTRKINNKLVLGNSLIEQSLTLLQLHRVEEASQLHEEALRIATEIDSSELAHMASLLAARIAFASGRKKEAIERLESLLQEPLKAALRAATNFHLTKFHPHPARYRRAAIHAYQDLYATTPQYLFKIRLEDLIA
jgi:predicted ATPase/class 3 adenylate cyclase